MSGVRVYMHIVLEESRIFFQNFLLWPQIREAFGCCQVATRSTIAIAFSLRSNHPVRFQP